MTLAEFKRRMKVGKRFWYIERTECRTLTCEGVVERANATFFVLRNSDGWAWVPKIPKACDVVQSDDDTITFKLFRNRPASTETITYRVLP